MRKYNLNVVNFSTFLLVYQRKIPGSGSQGFYVHKVSKNGEKKSVILIMGTCGNLQKRWLKSQTGGYAWPLSAIKVIIFFKKIIICLLRNQILFGDKSVLNILSKNVYFNFIFYNLCPHFFFSTGFYADLCCQAGQWPW